LTEFSWFDLPARVRAPALRCLRETLRLQAMNLKNAWFNRVKHKKEEGESVPLPARQRAIVAPACGAEQ
jgi:hypothetical protein